MASNLTFNQETNNYSISPISYTNKDFRSIYEELLDIVNDLTDRWDPRSTNESDPGLVLVKLKAFLADKLNYNIDKNTLENFPSQATQKGNAQKIYDLLGYGMKYYQSATTTIIMRYNKGNTNGIYSKNDTYTIPAFTHLTDDSKTVNYVTMYDTPIPIDIKNKSVVECKIIQGLAHDFSINGSTNITIDNLDADYRLYFTESMIAQNGIFINSSQDSTYWRAVDNLESTQLGQKVFKFGVMPVTNTCYIEFPQDAATLFGNGINIKYIITSGIEGNTSANVLTTIADNLEFDNIVTLDESGKPTTTKANLKDYTLIIQNKSATNGANPESLKDAYRNCQKLINTFNTLVTTQDYQNAIYNSKIDNSYVVSNCVVSDRTNDVNNSYNVVNKTLNGDRIIHLNTLNSDKKTPSMNAFNIGIYALNHVETVEDASSYDKTFQTKTYTIEDAQNAIENYKSIQHDYIDTINDNNNVFIFKNLVSLEGKVLTYQKITKLEAEEIENNIKKHLYKTYQARNVDFGKELDYNDLIDNIKAADERISTVILEYPEYHLCAMNSDNSLEDVGLNIDLDGNISYKYYEIDYYAIFNKNSGDVEEHQVSYAFYDANKSKEKLEKSDFVDVNNKVKDNIFINDPTKSTKDFFTEYSFNSFKVYSSELPKNEYELLKESANDNVIQNGNSTLKKSLVINDDIIIPDLTELQANIIVKSILSGTTPYFLFDTNNVLDYTMKKVSKYDKDETVQGASYNEVYGYVDSDVIKQPTSGSDIEMPEIPAPTHNTTGVAAITTSTKLNFNASNKHTVELRENENVFCVGPSYVSKAQLSTCLYYTFIANRSTPTGSFKYYITKCYSKVFDSTINDYKQGAQVDYDENNVDLFKIKEEIAKEAYNYYNNPDEYNGKEVHLEQEQIYTHPIISAHSYYKLRKGEYLIAAEGINTTGNLDLSGLKKYYIYSGNDGDIVCPTMDIEAITIASSNIVTGNSNYTPIPSKGNLGTSNSIEIFNENKIQINEDNKLIYAAWSMSNLYNQLFDIEKDLYGVKEDNTEESYNNSNSGTYEKVRLKKLLENDDFFIYTDEYKQGLVLLGSGTEIIAEAKKINSLLKQFQGTPNKFWSMNAINISQVSANGLNSTIEWNQIPLNISIFTAEKQIITLGEGTTIKIEGSKDSISIANNIYDLPENLTLSYKDKDSKEFQSLPSINGDDSSNWGIFSRLQLNTSPTKGQLLKNGQYVILYKEKLNHTGKIVESYEEIAYLGPTQYITSNAIVSLAGGYQQNSATLDSQGNFKNTLKLYVSGKDTVPSEEGIKYYESNADIIDKGLTLNNNNKLNSSITSTSKYTEVSIWANEKIKLNDSITINIDNLSSQFKNTLIPILFISPTDLTCTLTTTTTSGTDTANTMLDLSYNNDSKDASNNSNLSYFRLLSNPEKLKLEISGAEISSLKLIIFNPLKIKSINPLVEAHIKDGNGTTTTVDSTFKKLATNYKTQDNLFDYSYQIDEEDQIVNPLNSESFFSTLHPFNRWVIPQLNVGEDGNGLPYLNIKVSKQSYQSNLR